VLTRRTVLLGAAGVALGGFAGCGGPAPTIPTPSPVPSSAPPSTPARTGATPGPTPRRTTASPAPTGRPNPRVADTIADNLDVPWGVAFLASGDALISERNTARIRKVTPRGRVTTLGEVSGVSPPSGGEGGLLGIALAPGDEETLFAFVSTRDDNRVVRVSLAGGKIGKPVAVLTGIPSSVRHHGGRLLFGPDGLLYVSTGDAEQSDLAQDRNSLAGKILRIRPDGRPASGNPYGNRTWSYGHRNIEGLALDAQHRLWATEFGAQATDELNLISKGRNYGWPTVEGESRSRRFVSPKAVWSPTSTCSPAGLAITRSTAFVGALRGQCLFAVPLQGENAGRPRAYFAEDFGRIRNVVVTPDGALWMTTSNTDGRVDPGRDDDKVIRVTL
jgi:glucose/arabinose dehydrogenase